MPRELLTFDMALGIAAIHLVALFVQLTGCTLVHIYISLQAIVGPYEHHAGYRDWYQNLR